MALKKSKEINFTLLPIDLEKKALKSINNGFVAVSLLDEISKAEELLNQASSNYRPKLFKVRRIEQFDRDIQQEIKALNNQIEITDSNQEVIIATLNKELENLNYKQSDSE